MIDLGADDSKCRAGSANPGQLFDCWSHPIYGGNFPCADGYTPSLGHSLTTTTWNGLEWFKYTCLPLSRCDASKCTSQIGGDCWAHTDIEIEPPTCASGYYFAGGTGKTRASLAEFEYSCCRADVRCAVYTGKNEGSLYGSSLQPPTQGSPYISDQIRYSCYIRQSLAKKTFWEAQDICAGHWRRLCGKEELMTSTAAGTCSSGCCHDSHHVWADLDQGSADLMDDCDDAKCKNTGNNCTANDVADMTCAPAFEHTFKFFTTTFPGGSGGWGSYKFCRKGCDAGQSSWGVECEDCNAGLYKPEI